jgi:hypothetical protein
MIMEIPQWLTTGISALTFIALGVTYGDIRARVIRIEKEIFNGGYIKKSECVQCGRLIDYKLDLVHEEVQNISHRVENIERD